MAGPRGRKIKDQDVTLTIGQSAALCGVNYNTFQNWRSSDFPPPVDEEKRTASMIEMGEYIRERVHREYAVKAGKNPDGRLDEKQARARKDMLQADRYEMENQVRRGELIEVAEIRAAGIDMVIRVRARLLRLGSALAPLLVGQENRITVQNTIETGIRDALTELSVEWNAASGDDDDDGE